MLSSDSALTLNLGNEFAGLQLLPSEEAAGPDQFTTETLGLLAVSALKEEALLDFHEIVHFYDSADLVVPPRPIHIYLSAEVALVHPQKAQRSTVMWAIDAAAVKMMRTRYLRQMPFDVYYRDEHLYSGAVIPGNRPAALKNSGGNVTLSATTSTVAPLSLVSYPMNSSTVILRSLSPLQDHPIYSLDFEFVESPGSVISDYYVFKTLLALLLKLAPSDAADIVRATCVKSSWWAFMEEALPPVPGHRFQQYHAVAVVEAMAKYYELHGQYREMTFRLSANGRLMAQGCVTKPEQHRSWCAGILPGAGLRSFHGSGEIAAAAAVTS